jgi:hypothetical protein
MIAVEVNWIGTMMPSPRNPRQAATSSERALYGQVDYFKISKFLSQDIDTLSVWMALMDPL